VLPDIQVEISIYLNKFWEKYKSFSP
jgi:hypothetical protein